MGRAGQEILQKLKSNGATMRGGVARLVERGGPHSEDEVDRLDGSFVDVEMTSESSARMVLAYPTARALIKARLLGDGLGDGDLRAIADTDRDTGLSDREYEKSYQLAHDFLVTREVGPVVASELHEAWRGPRRTKDGGFEPRVKTTTDKEYIVSHGTDQVDIANTSYDQLPEDWQQENRLAAEGAVGAYLRERALIGEDHKGADYGRVITYRVAVAVHESWLERNREWATPEQKLHYDDLSTQEQDKDRAIAELAMFAVDDVENIRH